MTLAEALQLALQHHKAGRLAEAEALYRQILAAQPNHFDALHFLGLIAHQIGRHDIAVDLIRRSIALHPNNPAALSNLAEACRSLGRLDEAVSACRRALELQPDYAGACNNLGAALAAQGQLDEAIAAFHRALELQPIFPEALNNLGNALGNRGQLDETIAAYRQALKLRPEYPEAHNNLGNTLREREQLQEAIPAYRQAIELKPDYAEAHNNLGNTLRELGQLDEAVAACRHALQLKPDFAGALNNLGAALAAQGELDEALAAYRNALRLEPNLPEVHINLGNALRTRGQLDESAAACRRALELNPNSAVAHNNLGVALKDLGQLDDALAACRRAIALKPRYPEAHNNLGDALKDRGELDEAISAFRDAIQINPDLAPAHSNLIYTLHFHPGHNSRTIAGEQERWNRQFGDPVKRFILPHANDRSPDRRLRIGYVSPDFRDHVVGRYLLPLFRNHNRENFEVRCYSDTGKPDKLTEQFRAHAFQWRSTVGAPDEELAKIIREDGIDILVDLTQHLAGNRLPMFARKPAPVQVSFAGYPESTGLEAIEYRISDRFLEKAPAHEEIAPKEWIHLLDSFWCYDPCGVKLEVNSPPALESGTVTFGCLNNFCKLNEQVLRLWAKLLGRVKGSRLMLSSSSGSHRTRTLQILESEGIDALRVEFVELRPRREYLELYHRLDIALDTFPYNGGVTTCDALWMGAPVVSLAGETPVSRAGLSLLTNLGLPEWVAHSESEYVKIAESLAIDLPYLAQLRSTLRNRMENSILMNAPRFARNVEAAYRSMWQRWCASHSPFHKG